MDRLDRLFAILRRGGLVRGEEIQRELGISQPVMSRLIREAGPRISRFGRSRATRYAASREIAALGRELPVFRVDANGRPHQHGVLHLISGGGSWLERSTGGGQEFPGLPPFVEDMRPQGYIGRAFPSRYPELRLPERIRDWNDDHQLISLAMRGEDCVGDLIIGEESLDRFLAWRPPQTTRTDFPRLAAGALDGQPGSSAAGEQPKFAAYSEGRHVLVKFAAGDGSAADRWRDLLVCEHVALDVLRNAGIPAPRSEWFDLDGARYLQVDRFDRIGTRGRRGVISLSAINNHFLGYVPDYWSRAARRILDEPDLSLDVESAHRMIWLDTFGDLIANSDRHFGNFSFFTDEERRLTLTPTPVYDMLPMQFAPTDVTVIERPFAPGPPTALNMNLWREAADQALVFWSRLGHEDGLSDDFRRLAQTCRAQLAQLMEESP